MDLASFLGFSMEWYQIQDITHLTLTLTPYAQGSTSQKFQVKIEYLLFVSNHVPSSSFTDSANEVALSMLTGDLVW